MKKYRIWLTKSTFVEVEAPCPSMALEQLNVRYYWDIERI